MNLQIRVSQDVWHGYIDSPKSKASAADIPIGPKLAAVLGEQLARSSRESGFLFVNEPGRPLDPKYLASKHLYPVQECMKLPKFTWHALRHLHATCLGMNNVPVRIAQAQLRHRDPALTMNVYTHVIEEARRQAVEQVENDLFSIVLSSGDTTQEASPVEAIKQWRA